MPRGGVKQKNKKTEKKSVGDRLSSVSGTSALCHVVAKKNNKKGGKKEKSVEDR